VKDAWEEASVKKPVKGFRKNKTGERKKKGADGREGKAGLTCKKEKLNNRKNLLGEALERGAKERVKGKAKHPLGTNEQNFGENTNPRKHIEEFNHAKIRSSGGRK